MSTQRERPPKYFRSTQEGHGAVSVPSEESRSFARPLRHLNVPETSIGKVSE